MARRSTASLLSEVQMRSVRSRMAKSARPPPEAQLSTSTAGYFVSTNVPFDTAFTALHGDGRREQGRPRTGRVVNQLTVITLRMAPPSNGRRLPDRPGLRAGPEADAHRASTRR